MKLVFRVIVLYAVFTSSVALGRAAQLAAKTRLSGGRRALLLTAQAS